MVSAAKLPSSPLVAFVGARAFIHPTTHSREGAAHGRAGAPVPRVAPATSSFNFSAAEQGGLGAKPSWSALAITWLWVGDLALLHDLGQVTWPLRACVLICEMAIMVTFASKILHG